MQHTHACVSLIRLLVPRTQVLKYEADAQPGALGASVFGYNDAYAALQPLLRLRRAQLRRGNGTQAPCHCGHCSC